MKISKRVLRVVTTAIVAVNCSVAVYGADSDVAFKVNGKAITMGEVEKEQKGEFYEIDKRKYDIIERMANEKYLADFWAKKAEEGKTSVEAARQTYLDKNVKVSNSEVSAMIEKYKDNAQFKGLAKEEQQKQVRDFLKDRASRGVEAEIMARYTSME